MNHHTIKKEQDSFIYNVVEHFQYIPLNVKSKCQNIYCNPIEV